MRRMLAVVACLVIILGLAPVAFAQAPAPKVTINGLFDQVTSGGKNIYDGDFSRSSEREWYARTRFRPDFTFEVGRTKAVLGLEIDFGYGQAGPNDGGFPGNVSGANVHKGGNASLDINTDVAGLIEVKWIYTEFDLTGKDSLMPFIPVPTVARVGGQPFSTLANYKVVYANGDFAGASTVTTWAPNLKTNLAYVQIEDEVFGSNRLARTATNRRGDDWSVILSADITPFKGLDIKPLYSYVSIYDSTSGAVRKAVNNQQGAVAPTTEDRHTIGVDARFRSGPFSFDPTFMFQFGDRTQKVIGAGELETDIRAFIVDLQGGFQLGPLLLEARGVYTSGNKASEDLRTSDLNYFQPLDLDTGYWAGWSAIQALGIDYYNGGATFGGGNPGTSIGYDRYGRIGAALRATYSLTPELAFYGIVSPTWTAEKVDTDTTSGAIRGAPAAATNGGDSRYLGTEVDIGTTWRFAPNTVFDLQGAYYFAGSALDTLDASGSRDAKDGWTIAARIRMSF
jgi:Alginate export